MTVKGKVVDEGKHPLPGVTVINKRDNVRRDDGIGRRVFNCCY